MADDKEKKLKEAENKPKVKLIKKKNDVAQFSQEAEKTPAASTNSASVSAPAKAAEPKLNGSGAPERKKVVVVKKKSPAPQ